MSKATGGAPHSDFKKKLGKQKGKMQDGVPKTIQHGSKCMKLTIFRYKGKSIKSGQDRFHKSIAALFLRADCRCAGCRGSHQEGLVFPSE